MVAFTQQPDVCQLSDKSTPAVPDGFFHATEFILGAGIVVIQPSMGKIVVAWDGEGRWFSPKGRKYKSESLDKTALRKGYEDVRLSITPLPSPPLAVSDYLIPPCDIISNVPPHSSLQSGHQIVPLCTAKVSLRTHQRVKAPKQVAQLLLPALAQVSSSTPEKTQSQSRSQPKTGTTPRSSLEAGTANISLFGASGRCPTMR